MNEPSWCQLLDDPQPGNWTPSRRTGCVLLDGHKGDCTTSLHIQDGVDPDAAQAALEATADWHAYRRWCEIAPRRHREAEMASLDQPEPITATIQAWLDQGPNPSGSLLLVGAVGCGKTWAACATARYYHFVNRSPSVRITSSVDLFRSLRPEGGARAEDYIEPQLLVLDDLGIEKGSEWTEERMFEIVDARWRNCSPLIVTSNLTPSEMRSALGLRVYDRLRDSATAVKLPGFSRRQASTAA